MANNHQAYVPLVTHTVVVSSPPMPILQEYGGQCRDDQTVSLVGLPFPLSPRLGSIT